MSIDSNSCSSLGFGPEDGHWEADPCPNAGSACNCIGVCRPRFIRTRISTTTGEEPKR